ncbi:hypothetical protein G6F50_016976 [Rhizopus delemar]|uniref:Uncharacterized protein n=1 Tax=Rhizopus delemar TaxID=936053 RepID=A0A9P7C0E2_9FUNG|nr:hypothetical protein G6F50_016976 [Rhizopus delemar]
MVNTCESIFYFSVGLVGDGLECIKLDATANQVFTPHQHTAALAVAVELGAAAAAAAVVAVATVVEQ